jgi:hypothetical protein
VNRALGQATRAEDRRTLNTSAVDRLPAMSPAKPQPKRVRTLLTTAPRQRRASLIALCPSLPGSYRSIRRCSGRSRRTVQPGQSSRRRRSTRPARERPPAHSRPTHQRVRAVRLVHGTGVVSDQPHSIMAAVRPSLLHQGPRTARARAASVAGAVGSTALGSHFGASLGSHFGASLEDHGRYVVLYWAGPQTARRGRPRSPSANRQQQKPTASEQFRAVGFFSPARQRDP